MKDNYNLGILKMRLSTEQRNGSIITLALRFLQEHVILQS